jgi:hypothetical protein
MNRRGFLRSIPSSALAVLGLAVASAPAFAAPARPANRLTLEERSRLSALLVEKRRLERSRRQAYVLREQLDEIADATGQTVGEVVRDMGIDLPKLTAMLT